MNRGRAKVQLPYAASPRRAKTSCEVASLRVQPAICLRSGEVLGEIKGEKCPSEPLLVTALHTTSWEELWETKLTAALPARRAYG